MKMEEVEEEKVGDELQQVDEEEKVDELDEKFWKGDREGNWHWR